MAKLLEVNHLKKYFRTPAGMLHAVDDVSFSIGAGSRGPGPSAGVLLSR